MIQSVTSNETDWIIDDCSCSILKKSTVIHISLTHWSNTVLSIKLVLTFTQSNASQHQHQHRQTQTSSSHLETCVFSSQCSTRWTSRFELLNCVVLHSISFHIYRAEERWWERPGPLWRDFTMTCRLHLWLKGVTSSFMCRPSCVCMCWVKVYLSSLKKITMTYDQQEKEEVYEYKSKYHHLHVTCQCSHSDLTDCLVDMCVAFCNSLV